MNDEKVNKEPKAPATVAQGEAGLALVQSEFVVGEETVVKNSIAAYMPEVIIEPLNSDIILPTYAKDGDSGMDVYSPIDVILPPDSTMVIPLGFKIEIPRHPMHDLGYRWELQARPRGGISAKTWIRVANTPGTVDNGYRGEIGIILTNTISPAYIPVVMNPSDPSEERDPLVIDITQRKSDYVVNLENVRMLYQVKDDDGVVGSSVADGTYVVRKGDKIAQLVFNEVIRPLKFTIGVVKNNTDRGASAYGSTGINASEDVKDNIALKEGAKVTPMPVKGQPRRKAVKSKK